MTGVMHTDHFHPGCLAPSEHFVPHKVLGEGEQPVTAFLAVALGHILP